MRSYPRTERPRAGYPVRNWRWWCNGVARALVALTVCGAAVWLPAVRYRLVGDPTVGEHCLSFKLYLVDLHDKDLGRGDYVVFRSRATEPFYPTGTLMLKRIVGVSGDVVRVDPSGVFVNGALQGRLTHAQPGGRLWRMGRPVEAFARNERIPMGKWWVMGTNERSFDSRYWGYVSAEQIVGRAWPIW